MAHIQLDELWLAHTHTHTQQSTLCVGKHREMERWRVSDRNNRPTWNSENGARKEKGVMEETVPCLRVFARRLGPLKKPRPSVAFTCSCTMVTPQVGAALTDSFLLTNILPLVRRRGHTPPPGEGVSDAEQIVLH